MTAPTTTFDLLERFRAGDEDAFTDLFRKYQRRLTVLIHYKLGAPLAGQIEVDDVLQETMLRATRDLAGFTWRSPGSFLTWLSAIADHVLADTARYHGRDRRRADFQVPLSRQPLVDTETPSRVFARGERLATLLARLDRLPEEYRQAILMAKVEGLSTEEMSERLGKPRSAVALLVHRALKRLRQEA